jgi:hypothetical protein
MVTNRATAHRYRRRPRRTGQRIWTRRRIRATLQLCRQAVTRSSDKRRTPIVISILLLLLLLLLLLSSKRQATEQRKQLLLRLLQTASRGVCVLCGIDVHNRAHVRNLLSLVLKTDPSADPEFLRSIDEATLEELLGGVCGPFTLHQRSVKAHYHCLLWSPEVLVRGGGITGVADAVSRGRKLKCAFCRLSGATLGCFNPRCRRSYHLACTRLTGDGVCRLYRVANESDQGVEIPGVDGRYKLFCSRHVPSAPMAPAQRAITPVFEK